MWKGLQCFYILLTYALISVSCDCMLEFKSPVPRLSKHFGSREIIFTPRPGIMKLKENEQIKAYCFHNLQFRNDYGTNHGSGNSLELFCDINGHFKYKSGENGFKNVNEHKMNIYCNDDRTYALYESNRNLTNCNNYISYGIGSKLANLKDIIISGICYDLNTLTLKYANYLAYRPEYEFSYDERNFTNVDSVDLQSQIDKLESYFSFMSQTEFKNTLNKMKSSEPVLKSVDFNYTGLIQDNPMKKSLADLSGVFNIVWWRGLLTGNWRVFLDALEERSLEVKYNVFIGTSGQLKLPLPKTTYNEHHDANRILKFSVGTAPVIAPQYVWTYLKSLTGSEKEDFVVIGYNSPYFKNETSVLLCKDICDEIDWLKNNIFGEIRLMPAMGYVYCCHPDEAAVVLDNFPYTKNVLDTSVDSTTTSTVKPMGNRIIPPIIF